MTETDAYLLQCSQEHANDGRKNEDILKECECLLGLSPGVSDDNNNNHNTKKGEK